MKILKVRWRNFLGYGNKWSMIDLTSSEKGFHLLVGENGAGKSTINDVIVFGLFGKAATRKNRDLPNRKNKHLEVEMWVQAQGKEIFIRRGLGPSYFEVTVNGSSDIGDVAGVKNVQMILDDLYGIDYAVFVNVLSLNVAEFQSFLNMTPAAKRQIIDKIFGLSLINEMSELLKADQRNIKEASIELESKERLLLESIQMTRAKAQRLSEDLSRSRGHERAEYVSKKEEFETKLSEITEKEKVLEKNLRARRKDFEAFQTTLNKCRQAEAMLLERIRLYDNDRCPTCAGALTTSEHQELKSGLELSLQKTTAEITITAEQLSIFRQNITKLEQALHKCRGNIQTISANTRVLGDHIAKLDALETGGGEIGSLNELATELEEKHARAQQAIAHVESRTTLFSEISYILGENGVKLRAISEIIAPLNAALAKLLQKLGLNITIVFDNQFNPTVTQFGEEIAITSLSTGEGKKADFAVLMAVIRLLKLKFPSINLLFLDEIFSSLDMNAVHHVLQTLKNIADDLSLHVVVINHAPLDNTLFDSQWIAQKQGTFSTLSIQHNG